MKALFKACLQFVKDCCDCKLGKRRRGVVWRDEQGEELELLIPAEAELTAVPPSEESPAEQTLSQLLWLHEREQTAEYNISNLEFHSEQRTERCSVASWLCFVVHRLGLKPYILQTALFLFDKVIEVGLLSEDHNLILALGCLSIACKTNHNAVAATSVLGELVSAGDGEPDPVHTVAEAEMVVLALVDFKLYPPVEQDFIYLLSQFLPRAERPKLEDLNLATELAVVGGIRFEAHGNQDGKRAGGIETALAILGIVECTPNKVEFILILAGADLLHMPPEVLKLVKDWEVIERLQELLKREYLNYQLGKYSKMMQGWAADSRESPVHDSPAQGLEAPVREN